MSIMDLLENEFLGVLLIILLLSLYFISAAPLAINGLGRLASKNKPTETKKAKVLAKNTIKYLTYITFEFEDGQRKEFVAISPNLIIVGDVGTLTFQGNHFLKFERELKNI